jgi:hypothetical protein
MGDMGKWLMIAGTVIFAVGALFALGGRLPWFGNLPGDVTVQRGNMTVYMPCATMIVVSVLLTVVLNVVARLFK